MTPLPQPLPPRWDLDLDEIDAVPGEQVWDVLRTAWTTGNERWRVALLLRRVEDEQLYRLSGHTTTTGYAKAALGMRPTSVCRYIVAARLYVARPHERATMIEWAPTTIYNRSQFEERTHRSPGRARGRMKSAALQVPLTVPEVKRLIRVVDGRRNMEPIEPQHVIHLVVTLALWIERGGVVADANMKTWLRRLARAIDTVLL